MYEKVRGLRAGVDCARDLLPVFACLYEYLVALSIPSAPEASILQCAVKQTYLSHAGAPLEPAMQGHLHAPSGPLQDAQGEQQQKRMDHFPVASQLVNELMAEVMVHVGRSKPLEHKLFQVGLHWAALVGRSMAEVAWRSLSCRPLRSGNTVCYCWTTEVCLCPAAETSPEHTLPHVPAASAAAPPPGSKTELLPAADTFTSCRPTSTPPWQGKPWSL